LLKKCLTFAKDLPNKCLNFAKDLPNKCLTFALKGKKYKNALF
jgi:hypothetical protein